MLRSVTLLGIHIALNSGIFVGLVKLTLHYQWPDNVLPSPDPKIQELVEMLEGCQTFQILSLKYCGPRLPDDANAYPNPTRIVALPCLVQFTIEDQPLGIAQVLAHISIPPPPSIALSIAYNNQDGQLLENLIPAMFLETAPTSHD